MLSSTISSMSSIALLLIVLELFHFAVSMETVVIQSRMCGKFHFLVDQEGLELIFDDNFKRNLDDKDCKIYLQVADVDIYKLAMRVEELSIPTCLEDTFLEIRSTTGEKRRLCGEWPTYVFKGQPVTVNGTWSFAESPALQFDKKAEITFRTNNTLSPSYARISIVAEDTYGVALGGGVIAGVVIGVLAFLSFAVFLGYKLSQRKSRSLHQRGVRQ